MKNEDEYVFAEGDIVEHKLSSSVFGVVISDSDFGRDVIIRKAVTLEILSFRAVELRLISSHSAPITEDDTNVIDFTKEKILRADTKTEGTA